jgi:uncharacterized integral membrane protein
MTDEHPAPAEESRFRSGVHRTRRAGSYLAVVIVIAAVVFLILLIVRNTRHVKVDYVFGDARARVVWLIIVSALTGWVLGLATSYLMRRRARRPG